MYMVLDTETATLPFVKEMDEEVKKNIAIAKPLVYDIGWTMVDRQGNEYLRRNFLVQETFLFPRYLIPRTIVKSARFTWKCWKRAISR